MIEGSRALVELLVQEGIELVVGNPGSTELPLMDALAADARLRYVLALQEGAVLAIADGYAQATGRLAAVNLHAAPGLGNALGMLFNAKKAGSPLLVTAGQQDQSVILSEPLLWDDLATIARPFVKWSHEVRRIEDLPRAVHRAATVALAPPTGPVFLSIPIDVLTATAELDLGAPTRVAPAIGADRDAVARAAALLAAAQRPVIFAGDAVAQRRAHAPLVALAEAIGAPVYCEDLANTASFPTSHPLFAGSVPRLGAALRRALEPFDLLVSIGADLFTLSLGGGPEPVPPGMAVVHVDTDPWQLGKNVPTAAALLGDPAVVVPALVDAVRAAQTDGAVADAARRRAQLSSALAAQRAALVERAEAARGASPAQPLAVLHALGQALPPDAVVVEEALSSNEGVRLLIRSDDPQSFFGMRGGGIGWGLPAAVGIKLGLPDRPVVAVIGDGGSLYNVQALWTAAHERVPVVVVVLDNRSYRILKQRTKALGGHAAATGEYLAMDLVDPVVDIGALARAFGVDAVEVTTEDELAGAVASGIAAGRPLVVRIAVDGSV